MFEKAIEVGRKRKAKNHEHDAELMRRGNKPEDKRGTDLAELQQSTDPTAHGSTPANGEQIVGTEVDIDLTLPIPRRTRKRRPDLIPVPDNIPASKRRKQPATAVENTENVERSERLVEGSNVHNSVMRGRMF